MKLYNLYRSLLLEMSMSYVDDSEIITGKYIDEVIRERGVDYIASFLIYTGRDEDDIIEMQDVDDQEIMKTEEFRDYIREILSENLSTARSNINHRIDNNGNINIYRKMTVKEDWIEHLMESGKHIGIYWSWDERAAEAHWETNSNRIPEQN